MDRPVTRPLALETYRAAVALDEPYVRPTPASCADVPALVTRVVEALLDEGVGRHLPRSDTDLRATARPRDLLTALLTVRGPGKLAEDAERALYAVLERERVERGDVWADDLPRLSAPRGGPPGRTALWQGDIIRLRADAIVNAANNAMLGCFIPFHRCIDNVIHAAAGPRLRADMATIMELQGSREPTGMAKATRAYALPARFVLHTVGPIVVGELTSAHVELLASSYEACLDLAAELPEVRSVALCAVSTGVFGYPPEAAAEVAVQTVDAWIARNSGALDLVVFDVYGDGDRRAYERALGPRMGGT